MSAADLALEADVLAATTGNREAFARLIDRSRTLVCAIALSIVRDLELSRDVAQEVYVAVWQDLARLRNAASFLPWLRQLTRNKANEALRSRVRYERRVTQGDDELEAAADPNADIVRGMISSEERELLSSAIAELPDSSRDVVILFYQEDCSVQHVADLLGISEDAVKQRLSRARESLRQTLADKLGGLITKVKPSSTFTAAVLAALPLAQPKTAAAAGVASTAAKPAAVALKSATAGSLAGFSGAAAGLLGSLLGVFSAYRTHAARATTRRQRWHLRLFSLIQLLIAPTMVFVVFRWPNPVGSVAAILGLMGAYGITHKFWLPRIVGSAAERSDRRAMLWALLGMLFAFGAVLLASYLSR